MTKLEAARKWVGEMQMIPTTVAVKLMLHNESDMTEVTETDNEFDDVLPMWGWMFAITDICDIEWLRDNIGIVSKCGFRIYESEDFEYLLGIDGAGYDFYEAHWIPLYDARGLCWHDHN